jgi:class 3 adenylate cyclase
VALIDDLKAEVATIFGSRWEERDGRGVPAGEDLKLANDAVKLEATVLYADLADSTRLVDAFGPLFSAEIYKTFLHCAAKLVRQNSGEITAYDGDRIMAVFIGDLKNTNAAKTALKINYAVRDVVIPAMKSQYADLTYIPKHVVGIDTSALHVARTGVRGANDLVWVGRAANHAAKLASNAESYPTYISRDVYDRLADEAKFSNGKDMWTALRWTAFDNRTIYGSTYWWKV